jgi:predicted nuclease of predicted toxin-antitoxin system
MSQIRFLADENINNAIIKGLRLRKPDVVVLRVQDTPLFHASDPLILEWAAQENWIVITHDIQTMPDFAYERVAQGLPMFGVIEINNALPIGKVLDDLLMIVEASEPQDWQNQVVYLPL